MVSAVGDNSDVAISLGQLLERPESCELTNGGTRESNPALRETLRPVYAHVCLWGKAEDDRTKGQQPAAWTSKPSHRGIHSVCMPTHVCAHVCLQRLHAQSCCRHGAGAALPAQQCMAWLFKSTFVCVHFSVSLTRETLENVFSSQTGGDEDLPAFVIWQ